MVIAAQLKLLSNPWLYVRKMCALSSILNWWNRCRWNNDVIDKTFFIWLMLQDQILIEGQGRSKTKLGFFSHNVLTLMYKKLAWIQSLVYNRTQFCCYYLIWPIFVGPPFGQTYWTSLNPSLMKASEANCMILTLHCGSISLTLISVLRTFISL